MTNAEKRRINVRELVHQAQAGDLAAFELLTDLYEDRVYSLALRMWRHKEDAGNIVQQTFISALGNLHEFRFDASFRPGCCASLPIPPSKQSRKARGWILTISPEEPTEGTSEPESVPHPESIAAWQQSPEKLVYNNAIKRLLDDALAQLDEKHRLAFLLRDVEGLSIKETAAALGLTETNTKLRILRARLQLRELLTWAFGDADSRKTRFPIRSFPDSVFTPRLLVR